MSRHALMIAPMLDWTDRHFRYFMRLISKHAFLYTEMITTGAILHGSAGRFLAFDACEHPVALQLGGHDANELAQCAKIGQDFGYDEVNLNVGCPSAQVQSGRFGACLMKEVDTVIDGLKAMQDAVTIPVTIKTRIGVDEYDSYDFFSAFIDKIHRAGCEQVIIHARKAWMKGLSPKQNRTIPELRYDYVIRLKQQFPSLSVAINGGFTQLEHMLEYQQKLDGVMVGREAYHNPYKFISADALFFQNNRQQQPTRCDIATQMLPYIQSHIDSGGRMFAILRHMLGLFYQVPGARVWRRHLTQHAQKNNDIRVVEQGIKLMQEYE